MRRLGKILIVFILTISCSEDPIELDFGYAYQPLRVGLSWVYGVEETSIVQSIETTLRYELKVTLIDSFKTDAGIYSYWLQRQTRSDESQSWMVLDTWSVQQTANQLLQNESNITFVKLVFPPATGVTWNGNQYNNLAKNGNIFNGQGSEFYLLADVGEATELPFGQRFEKTLTVIHNDFEDAIVGQDKRYEVFAEGVGLIYKEVNQLEYCSTPACLGQQKVDRGVIYKQTLKSHAW